MHQNNFFSFKIYEIFMKEHCKFSIHNNLRNKNLKIDFSFDSTHWTSFIKVGSKLREGGGSRHILSWDRPDFRIVAASWPDFCGLSSNMVYLFGYKRIEPSSWYWRGKALFAVYWWSYQVALMPSCKMLIRSYMFLMSIVGVIFGWPGIIQLVVR